MRKQKSISVLWSSTNKTLFFVCLFLITCQISLIAKDKPVKVYIMIGQSNMIGFGRINPDTVKGTLSYLTLKEGKYPHLLDNNGNWVKRNDVWYVQTTVGHKQHWLQPKKPVNWYAGKQYDDYGSDIHTVLDSLQKYFPDYKNQGYEIAGFVWWQGHKDQNPAHAGRYELNLVSFIKSIRNEFNVPDVPFVLATIAFDGWKLAEDGLTIANAQLAVSGERGKYPEFAGNVKTVEVRDFLRDKAESPSSADYHYNHNAETHIEVGDKLGKAMGQLQLKRDSKNSVYK